MGTTYLFIAIGAGIGIFLGYQKYIVRDTPTTRLPDRPFPEKWRTILEERIAFYSNLSAEKKTEFENRVHLFLLNVNIVGMETEVTHEDRILVASGAIIPIFGFDRWHYVNLQEVQLYPDKFVIPETSKMAHGLVGWGAMEGKMLLSQKALRHGFEDPNDQRNVAIHEFIHILDKQDGKMDGMMMTLMKDLDMTPWLHLIHQKINEISEGTSTLRAYGATSQAEFLAVVSEFFFESPEKMKVEHPALYNALDSFFNPKTVATPIKSRFKSRRRNF